MCSLLSCDLDLISWSSSTKDEGNDPILMYSHLSLSGVQVGYVISFLND